MSGQIFEGKTVQEAMDKAAAAWGVPLAELEHEVVEEKTDDFWGLGDKILCVRVWRAGASEPAPEERPAAAEPAPEVASETVPSIPPMASDPEPNSVEMEAEAEQEADTGAAPEPVQAAEPAAEPAPEPEVVVAAGTDRDQSSGGLLEDAERLLGKVFAAMGFDCEATVEHQGEGVQISISGQDKQYLLEGRGRGLAALELVLNHAFRHRLEGARPKFRVDAGDFRSQRDEELRDLAYQVAHRAKETGEIQQTRLLNPYERRIVHLTLAEDASVSTRSEGSGFEKIVSVIPKRGGRR